eukprot:scaffold832_cov256-Skeletonema_marinoi.AAC.4
MTHTELPPKELHRRRTPDHNAATTRRALAVLAGQMDTKVKALTLRTEWSCSLLCREPVPQTHHCVAAFRLISPLLMSGNA